MTQLLCDGVSLEMLATVGGGKERGKGLPGDLLDFQGC